MSGAGSSVSATDPFVRRRRVALRTQLPVVAAVAVGGAVGASARYGAARLWTPVAGGFPWTTLGVNVTGCALMGVLMVAITELWVGRRLLRPLLGTGLLGGYTTFSTFTAEVDGLTAAGHPVRALVYLAATPLTALSATWIAAALTRRLLLRRTA